ncbi:MAG TPA: type I-D CRISPR-associated endonuclease Cas1 [Herpetosiphon sp.]|uniref:CRISPR-associated endonuclease Cas1 n=1 Tax=Herpetosiphon aurantiacus (strain ATCC 23779 / DSM 785 / 114-95) TaxID=316274 RepID=A9AX66_HERA2|nr:type I-D CRISPR-associated endonuclease Cas1d [Herpetosiphon sp.]ABX04874.1 CRISPR-associated protein Cas1 [Herpetosiphon aurantiacus DSM 785]HBW49943.1 type I-D CRISPR-associated endonuclease Cas1 [Herpetosiphon sp.]
MQTLYLSEQYSIVKREGEALRVEIPEDQQLGRQRQVVRVPLNVIERVVVQGEITLTASALACLLERRICTHFLSYSGRSQGALTPDPTRNASLRLAQYAAHTSIQHRFSLARTFVDGKLRNLRTQILRFNRSQREPTLTQAIERLRDAHRDLHGLSIPEYVDPLDRMHGMGQILGCEGQGSAAYWDCWGMLLNQPWEWHGRRRRPPPDPVNALLSYGYVILTSQVLSQLAIVGFDPYIGFLHQSSFGKPALALDLMEEFRPVIVDSVVLTVLNTKILNQQHFQREPGSVQLSKEGRKLFLTKLEERFSSEIQHPIFGYRVSYRRCIELQARLLAKALMGEIQHYIPFLVR